MYIEVMPSIVPRNAKHRRRAWAVRDSTPERPAHPPIDDHIVGTRTRGHRLRGTLQREIHQNASRKTYPQLLCVHDMAHFACTVPCRRTSFWTVRSVVYRRPLLRHDTRRYLAPETSSARVDVSSAACQRSWRTNRPAKRESRREPHTSGRYRTPSNLDRWKVELWARRESSLVADAAQGRPIAQSAPHAQLATRENKMLD